MDVSRQHSIRMTAVLLAVLAATQILHTALYIAKVEIPRQTIWGLEGVLFALLAAFAGAAMLQSRRWQLAWAAIAASAVLNVVQVGVGVTLFVPFREAAQELDAVGPLATAVVAFSFFVYNAAKLLLGMAAWLVGRAVRNQGDTVLGTLSLIIGIAAMAANAALMIIGREGWMPSPVAGASGVLATLLLALCLWRHSAESD